MPEQGQTPTGVPSEKMVPERDVFAVKRQVDRLTQELTERDTQITALGQKLAERESGGDVNVAAGRKQLYEDRQAYLKSAKELTEREKAVQVMELKATAKSLSAEFGVGEEELLKHTTPDAMRIAALEAKVAQKPRLSVGQERGEPISSHKPVKEMSTEEFEKHLTGLRAQAEKR